MNLSQDFIKHELPRNAPCVNDMDDPDDVIDRYEAVNDVVDILLEKVVRMRAQQEAYATVAAISLSTLSACAFCF